MKSFARGEVSNRHDICGVTRSRPLRQGREVRLASLAWVSKDGNPVDAGAARMPSENSCLIHDTAPPAARCRVEAAGIEDTQIGCANPFAQTRTSLASGCSN